MILLVLSIILFGYLLLTLIRNNIKCGVNKDIVKNNPTTKKGKYEPYTQNRVSLFELLPTDSNSIIFLGNSLTDNCEWHELFNNCNVKNRGIAGNTTSTILHRLPKIIESKPSKIFLLIGVNDLFKRVAFDTILSNYKNIIQQIKNEIPNTKLFVQSILPIDEKVYDLKNDSISIMNSKIKELCQKNNIQYIDLHPLFLTKEGKFDTTLSFDGLHLSGKEYMILKNEIIKFVN